jgi:DNA-directed RNA polymerase beta subunit
MSNIDKITNQNELLVIFDSQLSQSNGMIKHHIDSTNEFNLKGIKQIIENGFQIKVEINNERDKTAEDRSIKLIVITANITDVELTSPLTQNYISQKSQILTPTVAHQKDLTYSSPMYINADIVATAYKHDGTTEVKVASTDKYLIGKIPIMVKSKLCNTYNKSKETLLNLNEDPMDIGGYFIIKGNEWVIDNIESMTFNSPREFANMGYKNEKCRGDFISKPGDGFENSFNLITKYLTNDNIIIEITNNKFRDISIPFFVLFRAFGVCSDKEIIEHITYSFNEKDPNVKKMLNILERAFRAKYVDMPESYDKHTSDEIIELIGNKINNYYINDMKISNMNTRKYTNNSIRQILDNDILPHVGKTPNDRYKKVRFLGHLIRRLLMTYLGLIPSTDRDSYKNKRINPAGVSYAKIFKTHFNFAIVQSVKRRFRRDFKNTSFSNINLEHSFTHAIYTQEFERALVQAIITGDKSINIRRKQIANNLSSQQLHRKNLINQISTLRNINTKNTSSAKQSARANEMRRVHSSMIGYVCCVQSADTGEKVGMQKQMAISANICPAGSSELLKDKILRDSDLILLDNVKNKQIYENKLTKVFVNGDWIGCCIKPFEFRDKYISLRRNSKIDYLTTISLEILTNEIYFWIDIGRITRPLLIVYQNKDGSQGIKLTNTHIKQLHSGEIEIQYLIKEAIIEYITPEEQINCLIARDLNTLLENENNKLIRYTHVDIPQSIIGLPGLTSPFANHNQVARVVFQTNQVKQTCGWPVHNWPHRVYKELHYQMYKEVPLIKTISHKYTPSDGSNAIVAIMTYGGYNQEDSLVLNQGAVDKGLFTTYHFSFEKTELEKNEEFANPNPLETIDIKAYSNYGKLENGKVPIGTRIEYGDIIIGKIAKLSKGDITEGKKYMDRSVVYKFNEPAYVSNIIEGRNEEDNIFCKIVFRSTRKCEIGDKFSSRSGQKGTIGMVYRDSDMPFTKDGMKPDLIFNPHSLPTRMTISKILESMASKSCAVRGAHSDGTMFKNFDIDDLANDLEQIGYNRNGIERLYNGITGKYVDCEIFIGPIYYQRLQKFTIDTVYSHKTCPTDAVVRQPLDGKASRGGLRVGEMEANVLAISSVKFLQEKMVEHSDKYDYYICNNCNRKAIVNEKYNIYKCDYCGDNSDIFKVHGTWSTHLFFQEINSMGIGVKYFKKADKYEVLMDEKKDNITIKL